MLQRMSTKTVGIGSWTVANSDSMFTEPLDLQGQNPDPDHVMAHKIRGYREVHGVARVPGGQIRPRTKIRAGISSLGQTVAFLTTEITSERVFICELMHLQR